jgi:hypothetical protein
LIDELLARNTAQILSNEPLVTLLIAATTSTNIVMNSPTAPPDAAQTQASTLFTSYMEFHHSSGHQNITNPERV